MTNVQNNSIAAPDADVAIASLKRQADRLGVAYKSNTSIATLQKAISEKLNEPVGGEDSPEPEETEVKITVPKDETADDYYNEAMKLVRVIITPMESTKATNLESELFCAGNSVIGTVKRTIPFGEEWHVEQILLNSIKEKKYQMFMSKKNAQGAVITTAKLVPAYSISILDPLTQEELDKLAEMQIRTRSLEDE